MRQQLKSNQPGFPRLDRRTRRSIPRISGVGFREKWRHDGTEQRNQCLDKFAVLSNELSCEPSNDLSTLGILHCPADTERVGATNFNDIEGKISYFINLDAKVFFPDMPLDGDDNFAINGIPVKSGLLGLSSNTPILWTTARHKFVGNIGFADGSVAKISNSGLLKALEQTRPSTNGPITEWEAIREHNGISANRLAIP
jgi:prepilin-type processing-associated H-X9-DG protein